MLRPEMNLPERSEFSSQALLLIRFQILYFSQIPEWNKDPASRISVPFYPGNSEYFSVFSCFLKFGIVGDTADWMCAENSGIPPIGCGFWKQKHTSLISRSDYPASWYPGVFGRLSTHSSPANPNLFPYNHSLIPGSFQPLFHSYRFIQCRECTYGNAV